MSLIGFQCFSGSDKSTCGWSEPLGDICTQWSVWYSCR